MESLLYLAHYVHDLSPFAWEWREGQGIRYYGLAYVLGILTAWALLHLYARQERSQLRGEAIGNTLFGLIIGMMLGGRLGYFIFYYPAVFFTDPLAVLRVWEGGMASHGGFIGVIIALAWTARANRISFWHLSDLLASVGAAGLFFGRIANFINGELWGRISDVRWAVVFPGSAPPGTPLEAIPARHPSQLYQASLEGLALFIYLQIRFWKSSVTQRHPGHLAGEFLLFYAIARIVGEIFREPDEGVSLILGLNRGAFYSLFFLLAGLAMIIFSRQRKTEKSSSGKPV